jgi:TolB-like protein/Tfp pilus assembly protein PilF
MNLDNFFAELKRRNVYKVAVAYAVVGWLVIQVSSTVLPTFHAPEWVVQTLVVLVALGFPIALVIAWAFELTPEGLKRTEDVDRAAMAPQPRKHAWIFIVLVGAALSIGVFLLGRLTARSNAVSRSASEELRRDKQGEAFAGSSIPQKSIAVLPFENLSDDKSAAYFADGIQDEILTKLASIADLKVISRTSTARYKSKPEDLKTVSQQLGVANVLEGSVQKGGDKVRVNVQLIDARADSHLWAKTYDRDIKDVFAVESEVAQEIADSLQAKLSPAEANTLATAPTKDTAAYDLFLKGESQLRAANASLRPESFDQAIAWYQQAIARDPNFALAMARLAECRLSQHWFVETFTEPELAEVKQTVEHALALAPDLAQAHVAHGLFYYYGYRQYEQALAEFGRALQLQPNNAQALEYSGYVYRRQGQWQRCLDTLKKSLEQDPRNADVAGNLAQTYCILRMWQDAERAGKYALNIDPADVIGMRALLLAILNGSGDIKRAQGVLATFPSANDLISSSASGIVASVTGDRAYTFVFARDFQAALKVWDTSADTAADQRRRLSAKATIRALAGDFTGAQADAEKARQLLEERLRERPNERVSMRELIWVYLALKRDADALKLARQAVDLLPPERDALLGNSNLAGLAEVEARTGAASDAIAILRRLLTIPAGETVSSILDRAPEAAQCLQIDPVWDPIRNWVIRLVLSNNCSRQRHSTISAGIPTTPSSPKVSRTKY